MVTPKKILVVMNTMGRAGAEKAVVELLSALDERGYEVHLLSLINRGEMFGAVVPGVKILGELPDSGSVMTAQGRAAIAAHSLKLLMRGNGWLKFPVYAAYAMKNIRYQKKNTGRIQPEKALWKMISENTPPPETEYDLAIAFLEGGATYYVAEKICAKHKVCFVHIDYQKAGYNKEEDRPFYDKMEHIFAVSDGVREVFAQVFPEFESRLSVFHNIINVENIHRLSGQSVSNEFDGFRLLTVSRLHRQKGLDVAVLAAEKLVKRGYRFQWMVLGEGEERAGLEKMVRVHGAEDHFVLMGALENPYPALKRCDLYVHPSRFEGKSIAITEAQVLCRPIVASDCCGNSEQITDGVNGRLVSLPEDSQQAAENLACAIAELLDSSETRSRFSKALQTLEVNYLEDLSMIDRLVHEKK